MSSERKVVEFTRLDAIQRKPLDPVIDGILYANTLASIVGKSGSCKSFLAQGMCASIATGTTWHGRPVKKGVVFYIGGEGLTGIRKRFDGWSTYMDVPLNDAPLFVAGGMPALSDELETVAVIDEMATIADDMFFNAGGIDPVLVVIDTMARAIAGGDENSASDVGRLIRSLDWIRERWQCCVLVIHHTGHGEASSQRGRGSSAFYAALDSELLVSSDGGRVTVRATKAKDWTPAPDLYLDREIVTVDVDGTPETTLVLVESMGPSEQQRNAEVRQDVQRLKAAGVSIRGIASELGITKSKVEHEIAMLARDASQYRDATNGR